MIEAKNLLNGYVALDIETADKSNTAPCSIGYVLRKNGETIDEKSYLINPEADFNPIAMRIHKITPDMVKDSPTLADIWPEFSKILSSYPIVCHNALFDIRALQKAAARYDLVFPSIGFYCTQKLSRQYLTIEKLRLYDVCKYIGAPIENHHNSLEDARGCADIMDYFLENNLDCAPAYEQIISVIDLLDDFEVSLLVELKKLLQNSSFYNSNLRISKNKSFLDLDYYYQCVRFGKLRKGYYLLSKTEIPLPSDAALSCDSTKSGIRYFLSSPSDIHWFNEYIFSQLNSSMNSYEEYKEFVSEKTIAKNYNEYLEATSPLSGVAK